MIIKNTCYALVSALFMLLLPFLVMIFVKDGAGTVVWCMLLFFVVNPIAAVLMGILSGLNVRRCWFQPLLLAVLYLVGAWCFISSSTAFLKYGIIYLVIGYFVTFITGVVVTNNRKFESEMKQSSEELLPDKSK